jgi:rare lipoprotein A
VRRLAIAILMIALTSTACFARSKTTTTTKATTSSKKPAKSGTQKLKGHAVWYGENWHGRETASGEAFDMNAMTAAHRDLPLGSMVKVTNTRNGKSVVVRINDRGPYGKDRRRIIDVSLAAAKKLDFVDAGWTPVVVEVISTPPKKAKKKKRKKK